MQHQDNEAGLTVGKVCLSGDKVTYRICLDPYQQCASCLF